MTKADITNLKRLLKKASKDLSEKAFNNPFSGASAALYDWSNMMDVALRTIDIAYGDTENCG